jgi:RHS repeat-associated protein
MDGSGTWTRGYVYLGGQMLAIQSAGVSWVHQDPVTKSQRVTNSSGTVTSTIDLDPWGGETAVSSNQAFQPHRYTTYERDGNSGDEAMMRRYTGKWHRFDQPDPYDGSYDLTNPQSFNRYAYTKNDPVNFRDPSGLDWLPFIGSFGIGPPAYFVNSLPLSGNGVSSGSDIGGLFGGGDMFMIVEGNGLEGGDGGDGTGPQNPATGTDGHEFAHSRLPCPPTGQQLAKNPVVKKGLQQAFDLMQSGRIERGGWIYWNARSGKVFTILKDPPYVDPLHPKDSDNLFQVGLNNPPTPPRGTYIVGDFHSHIDAGPDDWDIGNENVRKVPGIVINPAGPQVYGPNRGIWYKDLPSGCR